jgi:ribosomal protein L32
MTAIKISWAVTPCSLLHAVCKVWLCQTPVHNAVKNIKLFTSQRRRKQRAGYAHKSAHLSKLFECALVYLVARIQVHFIQSPCSVVKFYAPQSYNLILKDADFLAH